MAPNTNGWNEYQRLVMAELGRHSEWMARMDIRVQRLSTDIALLKLRATMWGAIAGGIAAAGPVLFLLWRSSQ